MATVTLATQAQGTGLEAQRKWRKRSAGWRGVQVRVRRHFEDGAGAAARRGDGDSAGETGALDPIEPHSA
jgi:hypothetical protein